MTPVAYERPPGCGDDHYDINERAQRFEFAKNLIMEAGDLALQYFANVAELSIVSKGAQDMVSEADLAVETLIKKRLIAAYPEDAYLGEETGHVKGSEDSGIWVVDPIDGTQPFLSGLSSWCISIAYVHSNEVKLGMVNNPAAGELFIGGVGRMAELNGRPIAPREAQSVGDGLTFLGCNPRLRPSRLFQCSTAYCGPVECSSEAAQEHLGYAMLLVDA